MTPEPATGHHKIQGLLPWWANGTLGSEESRRVEAHLEHCPACQREALLLTDLQETLEEAPPVSRAGTSGAPAAGRPPRGRVLPWLGWAAAAVLAVVLGLQPRIEQATDSGPAPGTVRGLGSTRVVPTYRLDAVRRSSSDTVIIPTAPAGEGNGAPEAAAELQLLLHVDLGPGALPLDLVLEDAEGRVVLREPGIRSLYDGRFLFIRCATSEVPPGRYQVLLRGRGPGAPEEPVRYSFRVVEAAEGGDVEGPEGS